MPAIQTMMFVFTKHSIDGREECGIDSKGKSTAKAAEPFALAMRVGCDAPRRAAFGAVLHVAIPGNGGIGLEAEELSWAHGSF
jgi:hypothetical protein